MRHVISPSSAAARRYTDDSNCLPFATRLLLLVRKGMDEHDDPAIAPTISIKGVLHGKGRNGADWEDLLQHTAAAARRGQQRALEGHKTIKIINKW